MSHWRLHPVTRIVVMTLVALVAIYLVVTFVYRGSSPRPPAVVAQPEQSPPPQAETAPGETPPEGQPPQATQTEQAGESGQPAQAPPSEGEQAPPAGGGTAH